MTKSEKSWILYDVANSAYALIVMTALMPVFFKNYAASSMTEASSTAWWGYTNSAASLLIAFLAPVLGTFADYRGWKKIFLVSFIGLGVFSTCLLAGIQKEMWITAMAFYLFSVIGFAGANIFYDSYLTDVAEDERMDRISALGYAFGYIGSVIPFIIVMIMISLASGEHKVFFTRISFFITAVWWLLFSIPVIINVRQKHFITKSATPVKDSFIRLFRTFSHVRSHKYVFLFCIAYFFYIDAVDTVIKMAVAYGSDIGLSVSSMMIILLVIQIVAFPCAIIYGRLAEIFSAEKMLFVALAVYMVIIMTGWLLPSFSDRGVRLTLFWVLALLVASSQGGIQSLSRSYFGKIIPREKSAEFFGFYNIFGKFSTVLGPLLMGITTEITGNSRYGILSVAILLIIGALLLAAVNTKEAVKLAGR